MSSEKGLSLQFLLYWRLPMLPLSDLSENSFCRQGPVIQQSSYCRKCRYLWLIKSTILIWYTFFLISHVSLSLVLYLAMTYFLIFEIWFSLVLWHINHCGLFNAKSTLNIYIKYIWFGWIGFYDISTLVGYLMPNSFYADIVNIYDLVWFYGILTILGYLTSNPLYTYILNIYGLVRLGFMAHQPFQVI